MKLIDKDKLIDEVSKRNYSQASMRLLREQPEIKAIPKEWIKNYARHKASKGFTEIDCYWQSWEDDVLKMVAAWEKENE